MTYLPPPPSESRQGIRDTRATIGLVLIGAVMLAGGIWAAVKIQALPDLDEYGCPTDRPLSGNFVVLIDTTDEFNEIQKNDVKKRFSQLKDRIPLYARLAVYSVDQEVGAKLGPTVALCNPGSAEGLNRFTSGIVLIQQRWEEDFAEPLDALLRDFFERSPSAQSPIMERLQEIAVIEESPPTELMIVSDMLQNSPAYSHYTDADKGIKWFIKSPSYQRVHSDLTGVRVYIWYLRREGAEGLQGADHARFWEQYLTSLGAIVKEVRRISG